jgi:hypothetical protein
LFRHAADPDGRVLVSPMLTPGRTGCRQVPSIEAGTTGDDHDLQIVAPIPDER